MNTEAADEAQQGSGLSAVGKRLAAARQEQERELGSVATALHLNIEVVAALEAGDEAALPAVTFVRGYIKSYARLLGLDEQELLAMLPSTERYRPAPLKSVGMRRRQLNIPLGKWLGWLVALAIVVALLVYGMPLAERLLTRGGQSVEPDALPLPLDQEPGEPEAAFLPPVPETTQTPGPEVAAASIGAETPAETPLALPAGAEAPASEEKPAVGPAVVTLRFTEDSWVEMESHGRKLVVGTQPAGSERTVRAEPPVQLLLGNAPGVVVEYRGRVVDLKPYQRGKVARLVLED